MPATETARSDDAAELLDLLGSLRDHVLAVEREARGAARDARSARDEVARLRDEVVAAERDQQDLRAARARLDRLRTRSLFARILNRDDRPSRDDPGLHRPSAPVRVRATIDGRTKPRP